MLCDAVRQQLALYRELTEGEREAVQHHLDGCPVCMAVWEQYQAQDRALASLPDVVPSRDWAAQVRTRTSAQPQKGSRYRGRLATNLAVMALALVVVLGSTIGVSAQALPGSGLYPVKLAVEQARLSLTINEASRNAYRQALEEKRRDEVRTVAERPQAEPVHVAFRGTLEEVRNGFWIIDGIQVSVQPDIALAGAALIGQQVSVDAQAGGGVVAASTVYVQPTPTLSQPAQTAPTNKPTARPSHTPAPSATGQPVIDAIRATATVLDVQTTRLAEKTITSAATDETDKEKPTRRGTKLPVKVKPTANTGVIIVDPTDQPTNFPTRGATIEPSLAPTREPLDLPTPHLTRAATPRLTRVAPPGKETEPTPYPSWVATKMPTPIPKLEPTLEPTEQPTPWHKPSTVSAPVTVVAPPPTDVPPATPRQVAEPPGHQRTPTPDSKLEPTSAAAPVQEPTAEPSKTRHNATAAPEPTKTPKPDSSDTELDTETPENEKKPASSRRNNGSKKRSGPPPGRKSP